MNNVWIWVILVVIILGGGYLLMQGGAPAPVDNGTATTTGDGTITVPPTMLPTDATSTGTTTQGGAGSTAGSSAPMSATITYNGDGFSPKEVTIKKGGTVTWDNTSGGKMWVASATHPEHTVYDSTGRAAHCASGYTGAKPFDQCVGSTSDYSFTFDKVGTWGFHDHINSQLWGRVTVVE